MKRDPEPKGISPGWFCLYNTMAAPIISAGFHLSRFSSEKARQGERGRRGLWRRLEAAKSKVQGAVWFHASSVGEYEQARPILRALREEASRRGENLPLLVSVFSPSGYNFALGHQDFDHLEYLPLDSWLAAWRMVAIVRPRALVFVKFDCWPNLIWAARRRKVPLFLLDATLHRKSYRLGFVARNFYGRLFDCFDAIGAISEDDAKRFSEQLETTAPIQVTGDTRTDQVVHRYRQAEGGPLSRLLQGNQYRYLALGSVWPTDLPCILPPALNELKRDEALGAILVPHEPTPEHLEELENAVSSAGLASTRLSQLIELTTHQRRSTATAKDPSCWRCIVVDAVGVLADIYRSTILSYVGGSFSTGVHNVLEPAVCGQPVLFGPRIHNAYEAERLVEHGAGFVLKTPEDAQSVLANLLHDEAARARAGESAREFVLSQNGATEASVALLRETVFKSTPRAS